MKKVLLFLMAMVGLVSLNSCSNDDDGLKDPAYKEDAALFVITGSNSPYGSIEFTESGQYIITPTWSNRNVAPRKGKFIGTKEAASRANYDGYLYGNYTKVGDNEYYLEGFGTIVVQSVGGTNYDLVITKDNGSELTLGARRESIYQSSDMTDKLCRTWRFYKVHAVEYINGKKVWEDSAYADDIDYNDEMPSQVIFTRAGTYMVVWKDELDIAYWKWENEKKGIVRYSWNYDYMDDPDESGTVNVSFSDGELVVYEEYEEVEDGDVYKEVQTTTLREVR